MLALAVKIRASSDDAVHEKSYTIFDTSEGAIMLHVNHGTDGVSLQRETTYVRTRHMSPSMSAKYYCYYINYIYELLSLLSARLCSIICVLPLTLCVGDACRWCRCVCVSVAVVVCCVCCFLLC
eukprot:GHVS01034660.1.p1 GENE.GHVS01034660.1~~GHVS01034660.1.p1  ORF type:complete len:124 (-),score=3.91 GHVS01034660.1:77-448(-)